MSKDREMNSVSDSDTQRARTHTERESMINFPFHWRAQKHTHSLYMYAENGQKYIIFRFFHTLRSHACSPDPIFFLRLKTN